MKKKLLAFIRLKIICVLRNVIFVIISFEQTTRSLMSQTAFIIAMIYSFFDMWDMLAIFLRNMELAYWVQILRECSIRIIVLGKSWIHCFLAIPPKSEKTAVFLHWLEAILGESQLWIQPLSILRETYLFSHSSTAILGERQIPI